MEIPDYTEALRNSSLLLLYLRSGKQDKARESLDKIWEHAEKPFSPVSFGQFTMPFMACEFFLAGKEFRRTLDLINQLLADGRLATIPIAVPEFAYYRGRALDGLGQAAEAREILLVSKAKSEAYGTQRLLWKILGLLARIEDEIGDINLSAQYKTEAAEVIKNIAAQLGLEDLGQTFLALPEVREIIE